VNKDLAMKHLFISLTTLTIMVASNLAEGQSQQQRKKMGSLTLQKLKSSVPEAKPLPKKQVQARNVGLISPPSSSKFYVYDDDPRKAEYNRLVDEEIKKLYKLSRQYKRSRSRGEIWLRLGERYVEKAQIIDFKLQDDYDKKLQAFNEGKLKTKPRPPARNEVRDYHKRAIRLYEWFVRDFPKDRKVPQALYFLGYNNFEIGNLKKGEEYYIQLTRQFPNSVYVAESHFALGEYYFEKEEWNKALPEYMKVVKRRKSRLYTFALYKAAWCHYRLGSYQTALATLVQVIKISRGGEKEETVEGVRSIDKLRLAKEAVGDFVSFYEQTGRYKQAYDDFMDISRNEGKTLNMIEQLAYRYSYSGNLQASGYLFKQLMALKPNDPKAAKYQYQVVQDFGSTGQVKAFRKELSYWLDQYGTESSWARANKGTPQVLKENFDLQESTLRNSTLQLHQQAINARTDYSKQLAAGSYKMYLGYFKGAENYSEMLFFYGELLYDLQDYEGAAQQYERVALTDQKSKYFEKAVTNNVLAREKKLPTNKQMEERQKSLPDKLAPIPLSPEVKSFERASIIYLKNFPKGEKSLEIRRRLGTIYYAHNQFDDAIKVLRQIIAERPRSKDAILAAEIILDIHRLRNDLDKYQAEGKEYLANPTIASSEYGKELRKNLDKAKFLVADNYSKKGNNLKAAKAFEDFAETNPRSEQIHSALFNSAVNYQKAGATFDSIRMYQLVIARPGANADPNLKQEARNSLGDIHKKLGNLREAAIHFEAYGRNAKGQKAINALFNAAVIWDALNEYGRAFQVYNLYANLDKAKNKGPQEAAWAKAEMYRRQNLYSKAIYQYDQFIKSNSPDLERMIKAHFYIAEFYTKIGRAANSKEWYQKVIRIVNNSSSAQKMGAKYASVAQYELTKGGLDEMRRVRLGNTESSITQGLNQMKALQKTLIQNMAKVIKYDYGPMVVAALAAEADSYEIIGTTFKNLPVPKEYAQGDVRKQFTDMAKQQMDEFYGKAVGAYRNAFNKGLSLKAYGEAMLSSAQALYRLDPGGFKHAGEVNDVGELVDMMGI
jgi:cellulose synthase operon protein C